MTTTRADVRNALADVLEAGLSLPSGNVLRALPGKFYGMTPVVLVLSGGSTHTTTSQNDSDPRYLLAIKTYVLLGKADDSEWSSADTEAQLDSLDAQMNAIVQAHTRTAAWDDLAYTRPSVVEEVLSIDGWVYVRERFWIGATIL
mgnify:CR=1 FL=1